MAHIAKQEGAEAAEKEEVGAVLVSLVFQVEEKAEAEGSGKGRGQVRWEWEMEGCMSSDDFL